MTLNAFIDDKLRKKDIAEHFKNILLNTDLNGFMLVVPWGVVNPILYKILLRLWNIIQ